MRSPDEILAQAVPLDDPVADGLAPLEGFCLRIWRLNVYLRHHLLATQQLYRDQASYGSRHLAFVRLLAGWLRLLDDKGEITLVGDGTVDAAALYPMMLAAHDWWLRSRYPHDYPAVLQLVMLRSLGVDDARSDEIAALLIGRDESLAT